MVMSPEEFYAHAIAAADEEGRLPLSRMAGWEVFPFEQDGLRVVPLAPPVLPEPPRLGEGGRPCPGCSADQAVVWSDEHWRLKQLGGESGVPLRARPRVDRAPRPGRSPRRPGRGTGPAHRPDRARDRGAAAHRPRARLPLGRRRRAPARLLLRPPGRIPPAARHLPGALGRSAARRPGRRSRPRRGRRRHRSRRPAAVTRSRRWPAATRSLLRPVRRRGPAETITISLPQKASISSVMLAARQHGVGQGRRGGQRKCRFSSLA